MTRRMLIVDDEETIRWALAELFMQDGWVVQCAVDGDDAARAVEEDHFEFMITDLKMPGLPGVEVVRRARRANPRLGVLVLTGYASLETAVDAVRLGAWDYVTKPCNARYLRSRVDQFARQWGDEALRLASREPLTPDDLETFRAGAGTEVLSVGSFGDEGEVADAVGILRGMFHDVGLGETRAGELTQACLEALSMLPSARQGALRAGLMKGNVIVDVSLPHCDGQQRRAFVEKLGSRFGLTVRFADGKGRCHIALSEGL